MKYFRHLTTGLEGDRLQPVYAKFGFHKGYALYFMLLELCAKKYNGIQEEFKFESIYLARVLQIRRRNLVEVLQEFSRNFLLTELLIDSKSTLIQFRIPDLIEISDDYARKVRTNSGQISAKGSPKNKKENKKENKNNINTHSIGASAPVFDFEILYKSYPRKQGKTAGIKKLKTIIKTESDYQDFKRALSKFCAVMKKEARAPDKLPYFSTFVNQHWRDYLDDDVANNENFEADGNHPMSQEDRLKLIQDAMNETRGAS